MYQWEFKLEKKSVLCDVSCVTLTRNWKVRRRVSKNGKVTSQAKLAKLFYIENSSKTIFANFQTLCSTIFVTTCLISSLMLNVLLSAYEKCNCNGAQCLKIFLMNIQLRQFWRLSNTVLHYSCAFHKWTIVH